MYLADGWKDYEIIDAGNDEKLERWGKVILLRPDPQAIWPMRSAGYCDAHYIRSSTGGGAWNFNRTLPESWVINYRDLSFIVRPTGFKHTGLFPEQAVNWDFMHNYVDKYVKKTGRPFRVLNLFAYTGGATCALAAAGAEVVHVDAAKGIVAWAKNNLAQSGLADKPVRFIVDDVMKFVLREQRRGRFYEGILMDPPSYGRGPGGEIWKLEDCIYDLVQLCAGVLTEQPLFFLINSYTTGLSPSVMGYILGSVVRKRFGGTVTFDEIGLPVAQSGLALPCGSTAIWQAE